MLVDYRDDLVAERSRMQKRLRWHVHDLELGLELPPRVLDSYLWLDRLEQSLAALPPGARCRIALKHIGRCRELTVEIRALEREIRALVKTLAPELVSFPGCSFIGAAHLVGETAGAARLSAEGAVAMHVGTAPLPVSSGKSVRHRLNRCGNRKLNATIHMIALTQARMHPPAVAFMVRKQGDGMSCREALRCLKRHITRALVRTMLRAERARTAPLVAADIGLGFLAAAV